MMIMMMMTHIIQTVGGPLCLRVNKADSVWLDKHLAALDTNCMETNYCKAACCQGDRVMTATSQWDQRLKLWAPLWLYTGPRRALYGNTVIIHEH